MQHRNLGSTLLLALALGITAGFSPRTSHAGSLVTEDPAARSLAAQEFLTLEEALALAFPKCEIKRSTVYLTERQKKAASKLAKFEIDTNIVHPYEGFDTDGKLVGTAYFDTHRVRTKKETLVIVVNPSEQIARIEVCSFAEPVEYMPGGRWYAQFLDKPLDDELNLKRAIRGVTGATLTGRATVECARRVLALHAAIQTPEPTPDDESSD